MIVSHRQSAERIRRKSALAENRARVAARPSTETTYSRLSETARCRASISCHTNTKQGRRNEARRQSAPDRSPPTRMRRELSCSTSIRVATPGSCSPPTSRAPVARRRRESAARVVPDSARAHRAPRVARTRTAERSRASDSARPFLRLPYYERFVDKRRDAIENVFRLSGSPLHTSSAASSENVPENTASRQSRTCSRSESSA